MIRKSHPKRIIEIGSGFSTLIADEELRKNGTGKLTCIEPYPKKWLKTAIPEMELVPEKVQSLNANWLNEHLQNGDILFIDSTHTTVSRC